MIGVVVFVVDLVFMCMDYVRFYCYLVVVVIKFQYFIWDQMVIFFWVGMIVEMLGCWKMSFGSEKGFVFNVFIYFW